MSYQYDTINIEDDQAEYEFFDRQYDEPDAERIEELSKAMLADGYDKDRPLLVLDTAYGYEVLNGRHRLAAAVAAGLEEVPVKIIDRELFELLEVKCSGDMEYLERLADEQE